MAGLNSDCVHLTSKLTDMLISQKAALFLSFSLFFSQCCVPTSSSSVWPCITSLTGLLTLTPSLSLLTQPRCLSACGWRYYVGIDYGRPNTGWIYSSAAATPLPLSILIPLSELSPFLPLHPYLPLSHSFYTSFFSLSFSLLFYLFPSLVLLFHYLTRSLSPLDLLSTC